MRKHLLAGTALFAAMAVAPYAAHATIYTSTDGNIDWNFDQANVVTGGTVQAINVSGIGYVNNANGSSGNVTNAAGNNVTWNTPSAGGIQSGALNTPTGGTYSGYYTNVDAYHENCCAVNYASTGTETITLKTAQSYFGGLVNAYGTSADTISFYNGATLLQTINLEQNAAKVVTTSNSVDYISYLNVDFLNGDTYNKIVVSETKGGLNAYNAAYIGDLTSNAKPVDITNLQPTAPIPSSAQAAVTGLNMGNVHTGQALNGSVSVSNTAALGSQALDVTGSTGVVGSTGSTATASIAAGATKTVSNVVSEAAHRGLNVIDAYINLASDNTANGGVSTPLASQYTIFEGSGYDYAKSNIQNSPTIDVGAARVGSGTVSKSLSVQNTGTSDSYTEGLNATGAAASSSALSIGNVSISNLAAGGTSAQAVSLNTATSGIFTLSDTLTLASNGATTSGLGTTALGTSNVTLQGEVYQTAIASMTGSGNLGVLHRGQAASATLGISNTATGSLVDSLNTTISTSGQFGTTAANSSLISGAGQSITVAANTSTTGAHTGTLAIGVTSHDTQLADLSLGTQTAALSDTVYDYAKAGFSQVSGQGIFAQADAAHYTLDFGTVFGGSNAQSVINLSNILPYADSTALYTDLLSGNFKILSGSGFQFYDMSSVSNLVAGGAGENFITSFETWRVAQGLYSETIEFLGMSTDSSGSTSMTPMYLTLSATKVPEPTLLGLFGVGILMMLGLRRRIVA